MLALKSRRALADALRVGRLGRVVSIAANVALFGVAAVGGLLLVGFFGYLVVYWLDRDSLGYAAWCFAFALVVPVATLIPLEWSRRKGYSRLAGAQLAAVGALTVSMVTLVALSMLAVATTGI